MKRLANGIKIEGEGLFCWRCNLLMRPFNLPPSDFMCPRCGMGISRIEVRAVIEVGQLFIPRYFE